MRAFGWLLVVLGLALALYALGMDTSVAAGSFGRVNNIGLMNDQQNYLLFGGALAMAGILLALLSPSGSQPNAIADAEVSIPRPTDPEFLEYQLTKRGIEVSPEGFEVNGHAYLEADDAILDVELSEQLKDVRARSQTIGNE